MIRLREPDLRHIPLEQGGWHPTREGQANLRALMDQIIGDVREPEAEPTVPQPQPQPVPMTPQVPGGSLMPPPAQLPSPISLAAMAPAVQQQMYRDALAPFLRAWYPPVLEGLLLP